MKPTWKFERNDLRVVEGPNDAGIRSFTGDRAGGLVREVLQNSIDVRRSYGEPVEVSFEIVKIPVGDFDIGCLMQSLQAACDSDDNDERHRKQFRRGLRELEAAERAGYINALVMTDSNTTGASDKDGKKDKWRSLTRSLGSSAKDKKDSGGSFGIGKNAAFTAADLRTVLYSTAYYDGASLERRYDGRSILVSHEVDGKRYKSTGYLVADSIGNTSSFAPESLRLDEPGTSIAILGFSSSKAKLRAWEREACESVANSFFHALAHKGLIVRIFGQIYDHTNIDNLASKVGDDKKLRSLIQVSKSDVMSHTDIEGIGRVNLRILVEKEEDNREKVLAIVRDSGMLITDRLGSMRISRSQRMVSFPRTWNGFTAVVECLSQDKRSLLREAEGPSHDEISSDNADEEERQDVRRAIRKLGRWVRQEIEKQAKPPDPARFDNADEVAEFLPLPGEGAPAQSGAGGGDVEVSQPSLREVLPAGLGLPSRPQRGRDTLGGGGDQNGGGRRNERRRRRKRRRSRGQRAVETVFQDVRRLPSGLRQWPEHTVQFALDMPDEVPKRIRLYAVGEDRQSEQVPIERAYFGGRRLKVSKGEITELEARFLGGKRVAIEIKTIRPIGSKRLEIKAAQMKYNPNTYAPYPILRPNASDYPGGSFTTDLKHEQQGSTLQIECSFTIEEASVERLIQTGQAACCILVYCLSALYTEVFRAPQGTFVVQEDILSSNLIGYVEVHPSVISLTDLELPTNTAHHEYGGAIVSIARNKQLASSLPWSFRVKPSNTIESVFRLERLSQGTLELNDGEFDFVAEPSERYILIRANAETFDKFDDIRSQRSLTLATVYLNALITAVAALPPEAEEDEPPNGWAVTLRERKREIGVEPIGLAAQKMLGSPLDRLTELSQQEE